MQFKYMTCLTWENINTQMKTFDESVAQIYYSVATWSVNL